MFPCITPSSALFYHGESLGLGEISRMGLLVTLQPNEIIKIVTPQLSDSWIRKNSDQQSAFSLENQSFFLKLTAES